MKPFQKGKLLLSKQQDPQPEGQLIESTGQSLQITPSLSQKERAETSRDNHNIERHVYIGFVRRPTRCRATDLHCPGWHALGRGCFPKRVARTSMRRKEQRRGLEFQYRRIPTRIRELTCWVYLSLDSPSLIAPIPMSKVGRFTETTRAG
jgi:hypothetical protein